MRMWMAMTAMVLALGACNEPPPEKTVFDPMLETRDRARAVEDKLQHSAEQLQQEVTRQTEGDASE